MRPSSGADVRCEALQDLARMRADIADIAALERAHVEREPPFKHIERAA